MSNVEIKSLIIIVTVETIAKYVAMNALPRDIKADVLLASISGGTDIIAAFMGENSTLPVYRGEIQVYRCFDVIDSFK